MSKRSIYTKKLLAVLCLLASTTCLAQSPGAKILVLEREQGEKRIRRPREKMPNPTSEFILKVTPQNSGSQHLVLGTETIPPVLRRSASGGLGSRQVADVKVSSFEIELRVRGYS
jgi:hypothetical protein